MPGILQGAVVLPLSEGPAVEAPQNLGEERKLAEAFSEIASTQQVFFSLPISSGFKCDISECCQEHRDLVFVIALLGMSDGVLQDLRSQFGVAKPVGIACAVLQDND